VPIVTCKYVDVEGYMMGFKIDDAYQNYKFKVSMKDTDRVY
jgi:hypothetical protein